MKLLVSIIIPVYNTEKYIGKCLDSLVNQTYKELEIICVDDGSTDSSREIIHKYEKKDARIHLETQKHSNAGAARNKGMQIANGEYIAFLDSDDFFEDDMVEKMLGKALFTQADCVICRSIYYDNEKGIYDDRGVVRFQNAQIPNWNNFSKKDIPNYIFQLTACAWDKLYRMSFIRNNNLFFQEQQTNNDALFVFKSYILAERMAVCDDAAVIYRTNNSQSLQGSWDSTWWLVFDTIDELKDWLQERGFLKYVNRSLVNMAGMRFITYLERLGQWDLFKEYFERLKKNEISRIGLLGHNKDFYYNLTVYKKLEYISQHSCYEYLLYQTHQLVNLRKENAYRLKNLRERLTAVDLVNKNKYWRFKENRLPKGSKIVIYGYGDVGHDLADQLANSDKLELEAVIDSNYEKFVDETIEVGSVEKIYKMTFDYCIVAVWDKKVAEEIERMLVAGGILPDKIVWFAAECNDKN